MKTNTKKLTLSAFFLALGLVLPMVTGQIPRIGNLLLPMHLPVFLCGLICGGPWGMAVGLVTPLLRNVMFGMPPLFPTAVSMSCELAVYGLVCGVIYARAPRRGTAAVYAALLPAMLAGRAVWGCVQAVLLGMSGSALTLQMFWASAFLNAIPGIVLQLVLIPAVMAALNRAGVVQYRQRA